MTWFGIPRVKDWDWFHLGRVYPLFLSYRTPLGHPPIPGIRLLTPSISLTALPISIWLGWSSVLSWPYGFTCLQQRGKQREIGVHTESKVGAPDKFWDSLVADYPDP